MKKNPNSIFSMVLILLMALFPAAFLLADQLAHSQLKGVFAKAQVVMDQYGRSPVEIHFLEKSRIPVSSFFAEYKQQFNLSPENEFVAFKVFTDNLGQTHHRYKQYYKGIELAGVQYLLHEKNGSLVYAHGRLIHGLNLNVTPGISEREALTEALDDINARSYMWESEVNEQRLKREQGNPHATFYPKGRLKISAGRKEMIRENFRLVYRFDIYARDPLSRYYVDVDAMTGEVFNKISRIQDVDVPGEGLSLYNGQVTMMIDSLGPASFRLQENGRGGGVETYDMQNGGDYGAAVDFMDGDGNFTDPNDQAGVSAHWAVEATYDYYLSRHGRNSYDDSASVLLSYVHFGSGFNNAFWDGQRMTFGDGDGLTFTPLVSIDVAGHELTHGVTQFSAGLIYQGESGALNESFSDIFGTRVEFYREGASGDWLIGEDITPNGRGIRSMEDPASLGDPDTYFGNNWAPLNGGDNGGVHTNSGVQNFWFYLLSEGGSGVNDNGDAYSVSGIGMENAARIAYRNLTVYLMPSSGYFQDRRASMNSAIDLFGQNSPEYQSVLDAWYAVGVYHPNLEPTVGVSSDTLNFVAETGVSSDTISLAVINQGLDSLMITNLQISGSAFQLVTPITFPAALNNYLDTLLLSIVFTPSLEGTVIEALDISSNDPAAPVKSVYLKGRGFIIHPVNEGVIYAVTGNESNGAVLTLEQNNGSGTLVGASGFSDLTGVSIRPSKGELYATVVGGSATLIVRVNAQAGDAYEYVSTDVSNIRSIAFDSNDDLYGGRFPTGELFLINADNGVAVLLGSTGIRPFSGLAVNPVDGQLWGASVSGKIYTINKTTAQATLIGNTGLGLMTGIMFDAEGKLFGLAGFGNQQSRLIRIDTASGAGTDIGPTGFAEVNGLAIRGTAVLGLENEVTGTLPTSYELHQNFPNPFNPETTIQYQLPEAGDVILTIFDILGREIRTLVEGRVEAGYHRVVWDGHDDGGRQVGSGVYFYRLDVAGKFSSIHKMVLLR